MRNGAMRNGAMRNAQWRNAQCAARSTQHAAQLAIAKS
jgi:hypothetical protein